MAAVLAGGAQAAVRPDDRGGMIGVGATQVVEAPPDAFERIVLRSTAANPVPDVFERAVLRESRSAPLRPDDRVGARGPGRLPDRAAVRRSVLGRRLPLGRRALRCRRDARRRATRRGGDPHAASSEWCRPSLRLPERPSRSAAAPRASRFAMSSGRRQPLLCPVTTSPVMTPVSRARAPATRPHRHDDGEGGGWGTETTGTPSRGSLELHG